MVDTDSVRRTAKRLAPHAIRTPVVTSDPVDEALGCRVFFKCENLQRSGAFKFRGACNALLILPEAERTRGVITVSSGNHGAALALAGKRLDTSVWVVSQRTAAPAKVRNMERHGARLHFTEPGMAPRAGRLAELTAETGRAVIHPYDDEGVIAGQGTAALELIEEVDDLDALFVPVGGGGLSAGTVLACGGADHAIRVIAAEPAGADDAFRSLESGVIEPSINPETCCDGLLTSLGTLNFSILRTGLDRIIRVEDDDTLRALRILWEEAHLVVESSSAIALAALFALKNEFSGCKVGVILSGGNVSRDTDPRMPRFT